MIELRRTETSKTFDLGKDTNGRQRYALDTYIGAIHYKDASGFWQDIDTNFAEVDSGDYFLKFTRLPYLVRIANDSSRRIYPDRNDLSYWIDIGKPFPSMGAPVRSGNVFAWGFPNAKLIVALGRGAVKFNALLKNSSAPSSLTIPFNTQGITRRERNLLHDGKVVAQIRKPYAEDANGIQRDLTITWGSGSVTLALNTAGLTYPIEIDPTIDVSVGASADDAYFNYTGSSWSISTTSIHQNAGYGSASYQKVGGGIRWAGVTVPQGATIAVAYITLVASVTNSNNTVNTRLTGEDADDPAAFSTAANYQARRGIVVGGENNNNITTAQVDWDAIPAWTAGSSYNSPSLVSIIQEIVDRVGYVGDHVVIFYDDHDARTTIATDTYRAGASWDHTTYAPPALHIEYTAGGLSIPVAMHHYKLMRR